MVSLSSIAGVAFRPNVPNPGLYNVIPVSGSGTSVSVVLIDVDGKTFATYSVTTGTGAGSLGALVSAVSAAAAANWLKAAGGYVIPAGDLRVMTSGSNDDGSTLNLPLPTASLGELWPSGAVSYFGWTIR